MSSLNQKNYASMRRKEFKRAFLSLVQVITSKWIKSQHLKWVPNHRIYKTLTLLKIDSRNRIMKILIKDLAQANIKSNLILNQRNQIHMHIHLTLEDTQIFYSEVTRIQDQESIELFKGQKSIRLEVKPGVK